jgi:hypothetical protein
MVYSILFPSPLSAHMPDDKETLIKSGILFVYPFSILCLSGSLPPYWLWILQSKSTVYMNRNIIRCFIDRLCGTQATCSVVQKTVWTSCSSITAIVCSPENPLMLESLSTSISYGHSLAHCFLMYSLLKIPLYSLHWSLFFFALKNNLREPHTVFITIDVKSAS